MKMLTVSMSAIHLVCPSTFVLQDVLVCNNNNNDLSLMHSQLVAGNQPNSLHGVYAVQHYTFP